MDCIDSNTDTEAEYLTVDTTWGNDSTIEFLQLIQTEPSIWDPKHKHNRNRLRKHDAWVRIQQNFSLPCTLEELKRKRNSLMTTYREKLRRLEGSTKPAWFAFEVMHSYLGPVYTSSGLINESSSSTRKRQSSQSCSIVSEASMSEQLESRANQSRKSSVHSEQEYLITKKHKPDPGSDTSEDNEAEDTYIEDPMFEEWLNGSSDRNKECNVYGQIVAEKLKYLHEKDRVSLMKEISDLMSRYDTTIK